MRIAVMWAVALVAMLPAHSETPAGRASSKDITRMLREMADWQGERKQHDLIERRALELRPGRRDTPLRYLNISDEEVREVQLVSAKYLPRATLNISPVVTDCPCEEGPTCTAQVYLLASKDDKARGLQLSRMNNRWAVGVVQQWWLRRDALHKPNTGDDFADRYQYQKALHELYAEFPVCVGQLVPAEKIASAPKSQPTK